MRTRAAYRALFLVTRMRETSKENLTMYLPGLELGGRGARTEIGLGQLLARELAPGRQ